MNIELWKFEWEKDVKIELIDGSVFICNTEDFFDKEDTESELDEISLVVKEILLNNNPKLTKTRHCISTEIIKSISFAN